MKSSITVVPPVGMSVNTSSVIRWKSVAEKVYDEKRLHLAAGTCGWKGSNEESANDLPNLDGISLSWETQSRFAGIQTNIPCPFWKVKGFIHHHSKRNPTSPFLKLLSLVIEAVTLISMEVGR